MLTCAHSDYPNIDITGPTPTEGGIPVIWVYVKLQAAWGYPWIEKSFVRCGAVKPGPFETTCLEDLMETRNKALFDDRGFTAVEGYVRVDLTHNVAEIIVSIGSIGKAPSHMWHFWLQLRFSFSVTIRTFLLICYVS